MDFILLKFLRIKSAFATNIGGQTGGTLDNPLGETSDIYALLDRIADYLIWIAVPITTIMILWGAFQILTAAGDPSKVKSGRSTVIWALVGLLIVIVSKGATFLIKDILGAN